MILESDLNVCERCWLRWGVNQSDKVHCKGCEQSGKDFYVLPKEKFLYDWKDTLIEDK